MITNYAKNRILEGMFGSNSSMFGASTYLALSSTIPNADQTGEGFTNWNVTEPTGNGYERHLVGNYNLIPDAKPMGSASNGEIKNAKEIHFNVATADWGEMKYACIFNAKTGGNLIAFAELGKTNEDGEWVASPVNVVTDTVVVIPVGSLKITID